jgi:GNAT superfamily N-acetyltransferase
VSSNLTVGTNQFFDIFISMKTLIKQLLREGLTGQLDYKIEHMGSHHGQDDYELGVYLNDDILGMVQYTIYNGELTVSDIIVLPKYRRLGIGSKMMQYIKQEHPDAKYVPSMMTDLGAKFKHKHHDDLFNMTEESTLNTEYGVFEIKIFLANMDMKYYFQARPMDEIRSDRVFIRKGSAGNKSISTKNIKLLKTFNLPNEKDEMEVYLNQLRNNEL